MPAVNAEYTIKFNNPIRPSTVNSQTFRVTQSGADRLGTITFSHGDRVATFRPATPLAAGVIRVILGADILDADGAQVFPSDKHLSSIYLQEPSDMVAPAIDRLTPPAGATGVPVNNPIEIMFDEQINTAELAESDITVTGPNGALAHCTLTLSSFGVRLSPTVALIDNTSYTVSLSNVRDLAGNAAGPITFSFMTGEGVDFAPPHVQSRFPSGQLVSRTGALILTFSEPLHPPSVDASTIYLEKITDGSRPPVAISLDATGQVVSISPTQPLEASASYKVVVTSLVQDRGGLPFQSSFDWTVTADAVVDTTPPILTILPSAGATDVAINASVFVSLDAPAGEANVTSANVRLLAGGQPIPAELTLRSDRMSIRLRPLTPLPANTAFTVSVDGLEDVSGNAMSAAVTSTFTTGVDPDLVGPTLVSSTPAANATGVPADTPVQLTFSEPVVGRENAFVTPVPFDIEYSAGGAVVTLTPRIPFTAGSSVRIDPSVTDLAGNRLGNAPPLVFTIAP